MQRHLVWRNLTVHWSWLVFPIIILKLWILSCFISGYFDSTMSIGLSYLMLAYVLAGSTLEAMALAVEKAAVVLVCMSQKYKDSPNCRTGRCQRMWKTSKYVLLFSCMMVYCAFKYDELNTIKNLICVWLNILHIYQIATWLQTPQAKYTCIATIKLKWLGSPIAVYCAWLDDP